MSTEMVVCPVPPFTVLAASGTEQLGYHRQTLLGQSVLQLKGPATDEWTLTQAISGSVLLKPSSAAVVLHCQDGTPQPSLVSCEPLILNASFIGCRMRILRFDPITLETCFQLLSRSSAPQCHASPPMLPHLANTGFLNMTGCSGIDATFHDVPSFETKRPKLTSIELMRILSAQSPVSIGPKTQRNAGKAEEILCLSSEHAHIASTPYAIPAADGDSTPVTETRFQTINMNPGLSSPLLKFWLQSAARRPVNDYQSNANHSTLHSA